jgi:4-alpha-glucanotransferase
VKALLEAKRVLKRRIKLSFAKFLKNMNLENFMKKKRHSFYSYATFYSFTEFKNFFNILSGFLYFEMIP